MRPGLLIVLDGFAYGDDKHPCNAVALANAPFIQSLRSEFPSTEIQNNEHHVGLPEGQMGNSEVGHMNIGAGRVLYQDFLRINRDIERGIFARNQAIAETIEGVQKSGGTLHLIGLLGPGGVHAHETHFEAVLRAAKAGGLSNVAVHPITDGRDTMPRSAIEYLATLEGQIKRVGVGRVASCIGRYNAMDRDKRWNRTKLAYDLYRTGTGAKASTSIEAAKVHYAAEVDDEFWPATVIGEPAPIQDGDSVIFLNFRPDRARQLTRAFMQPDFSAFERKAPKIEWLCMTQYDDEFVAWPRIRIAYPPNRPTLTLPEIISNAGLTQLRIAETEKYAHITYFLSGGREEEFPGESRKLIPSPKVATYDLQPEMSAFELTDELLQAIGDSAFDFIAVNYANGDMVGHTGILSAGIKAVETLDDCLRRVVKTALACGFVIALTSDHGNCEEMCLAHHHEAGERLTNHTMLPSPFIVMGAEGIKLREGALCNVAATLLELMGISPSPEMEPSLIVR